LVEHRGRIYQPAGCGLEQLLRRACRQAGCALAPGDQIGVAGKVLVWVLACALEVAVGPRLDIP